ncbi:MAG TPA: outer membrane beta-barrel protein [Pyrinomonadaceae bacterium]|nr:outer membrane beta-barrel protein [Pyrinomonadaceae bacterium]
MNKIVFTVFVIFSCALLALAQDDFHKLEVSGGYSFERPNNFPGDVTTAVTPPITGLFLGTTVTTGAYKSHSMNGFTASATYNVSKYIGIKFEYSNHSGSDSNHLYPLVNFRVSTNGLLFVIPTADKSHLNDQRYLGGIQIKNNSKEKKIKPFAHALFGVARQKTTNDFVGTGTNSQIGKQYLGKYTAQNFSMVIGGGLDIRLNKRFDLRVIQFDYNPVFTKEQKLLSIGDTVDITGLSVFGATTSTPPSIADVTIPKKRQDGFRIGVGIVFH